MLKGRTREMESTRACSFAFMSSGFSALILNKRNSYYRCSVLKVLVSQEQRPKPQLSIPFTPLSVKLKTVKSNPWDERLGTKEFSWILDIWLVLGNICHTVAD